jgi:DNA-binding response OmpR family regulator
MKNPRVSETPGANFRLLLIEDDPALGMVTVEVLNQLGYDVEWSASSDEAQTALSQRGHFNAMILDLGLGQENGVSLVAAMHANGYEVPPIIIFSAQPPDALIRAAAETCAVGILQKPCSVQQLETRLNAVLHADAPVGAPR